MINVTDKSEIIKAIGLATWEAIVNKNIDDALESIKKSKQKCCYGVTDQMLTIDGKDLHVFVFFTLQTLLGLCDFQVKRVIISDKIENEMLDLYLEILKSGQDNNQQSENTFKK